ncbi:MAG: tetratricopeptide repeat protein [Bacteroidota bacterium]|nr:tetratricopeptide repeat protein [Bacteroidota bacterium]
MWWYLLGVCLVFSGCQVQPVRRTVPPLLLLEQRLQPEPKPSTNSEGSSSIQEPDTAVAGVSVRRLPTIRESMERLAAEQGSLRETLEEVQQDIQRMGLLLSELTELARSVSQTPESIVSASNARSVRGRRQRKASSRSSARLPDTTVRVPGGTPTQAVEMPVASEQLWATGDLRRRYAQALQHIARREYAEAWVLLERVLMEAKDPVFLTNVRYWRGDIAFRQGNYGQAITELEAVLQNPSAPKAAAAHALLAESCLKQGDRERARQTLQALVRRFPTSEFAPRARKLLQQL